jgi:hypothetical protein
MMAPDAQIDTIYWLDPGLPDIDAVHWVAYLTADELHLDHAKLTIAFRDEQAEEPAWSAPCH